MTARAFATHGNRPVTTFSAPYFSTACSSVRPTPAGVGVGVDRPRHGGRLRHLCLVPGRVLRGDLALAVRRVRELPVAGDVAGGVDVVDGRPPVRVRANARLRIERDPGGLEAD